MPSFFKICFNAKTEGKSKEFQLAALVNLIEICWESDTVNHCESIVKVGKCEQGEPVVVTAALERKGGKVTRASERTGLSPGSEEASGIFRRSCLGCIVGAISSLS